MVACRKNSFRYCWINTSSRCFLRYSDEVHTIAKGVKRGKGIRKGMGKLSGKWIKANEAMSDLSRSYQKQIAGTDMVWLQNGVKFDGINAGRLIEARQTIRIL